MAAIAFRASKNLFFFDTEFIQYSNKSGLGTFLAQIALVGSDGTTELEATIDYGLSFEDMLETFLTRSSRHPNS